MSSNESDEGEEEYFFTKRITLRNGRVLYAHEVGKQAFKIPIRKKKRSTKSPKKRKDQ